MTLTCAAQFIDRLQLTVILGVRKADFTWERTDRAEVLREAAGI